MNTSFILHSISFFCLFWLVASCTQSSINLEEEAFETTYFDLNDYAEKEVARLNKAAYQFRKIVTINGEVETLDLDALDLVTELNFLSKNNINRPALVDRYTVDSIMNTQGNLQRIVHEATDEDLALQYLEIEFDDAQEVSLIELRSGSTSRLLAAQSEAIYTPTKGYLLSNKQQITLFGEQDMTIEVKFLEK